MRPALLLSGGLESTALAYWKRPEIAYTFDYGQAPAEAEIEASKRVCDDIRCEHHVVKVNLAALGAGPLAGRASSKLSKHEEWWPFRNQLLLTLGGMCALRDGVTDLLIGTVRNDSRHADGKPVFVRTIRSLMLRQEGRLRLHAPALRLSSLSLIKKSRVPSVALLHTFSCHRGGAACGHCPGCVKRLATLKELGLG